MKKLLQSKKLRVTAFRLAVLDVFGNHENAISVEDIEHELGEFDRITLYRTLKIFKEKGLIHEISMPDSVKKMALCIEDCSSHEHVHEHVHFKCDDCGEVYCLEVEKFPEINLKGFQINQLEIQASGQCRQCS